jgi:hypothetical protein
MSTLQVFEECYFRFIETSTRRVKQWGSADPYGPVSSARESFRFHLPAADYLWGI